MIQAKSSQTLKKQNRKAFTLVELLVVMSIIAILAAMLMPAVNSVREQGRRTQCMNNMRNAGIALTQFDAKKGVLPGFRQFMGPNNTERSWVFAVLPELERNDIYRKYISTDTTTIDVHIPVLTCPNDSSSRRGDQISMVVNAGRSNNDDDDANSAVFHHHGSGVTHHYVGLSQISAGDGTAQTLMVSENVTATGWNALGQTANCFNFGDSGDTYRPNFEIKENVARASSYHPGGVNVVWCDSHTSFISDSINNDVWKLLFTPFGQNMGTRPQTAILNPADLEAL